MVYSLWRWKRKKKPVRLNIVILTKVRMKSINDIALPNRAQNNLRGDAIRLGDVYVCDDAPDEILGTMFSMEELKYDEYFGSKSIN